MEEFIKFRVSKEEKQLWKEYAANNGTTVSKLIRDALNGLVK